MERRQIGNEAEKYGQEETLRYFANTFIEFLKIMYGSGAAPEKYRWSPDEANRKLDITAATSDNLKSMDTRPRIAVARGPVRWHNYSGIGHLQATKNLGTQTNRLVTDLVSGSVVIHCLSKEDLESEKIANDVLMLCRRFKQILATSGLLTIKDFQAAPTAIVRGQGGGVEAYVTAVQISMQAQDSWLLENRTNVTVKKITTIVEQNC